jgi:hypothetical protein
MVAHRNATTKNNDGIICDLCNTVYTTKFEYFSADITHVEVDANINKIGIKGSTKHAYNLDICQKCMEEIKTKILDNIHKREKSGVWSTGG